VLQRRPSRDWGWDLSPYVSTPPSNDGEACSVLYNLPHALAELADLPAVVRELRERVRHLEEELQRYRREAASSSLPSSRRGSCSA
jgi:hypothetical protein